jgi:hypothetical protein
MEKRRASELLLLLLLELNLNYYQPVKGIMYYTKFKIQFNCSDLFLFPLQLQPKLLSFQQPLLIL